VDFSEAEESKGECDYDYAQKQERRSNGVLSWDLAKAGVTPIMGGTKLSRVRLNWKEVCYTNCPVVSASKVD